MENEVDVTILPRTEDLVVWLVSLVPVIFLLLWDVWKAWKRRAFWIPGQALVLSALIIQLLSFIDYSHIRVYSGSRYQTKEVVAILVKNQLVIDSGRLMLCVLIAYLLPGMARSGSITDGSNLAALALSIIFHVSELRGFHYIDNVLKGDALKKLLPQDMSRAKKVRLLLTARDENVKNACPRPCTELKIYKMEGIQDQEGLIISKKEIKAGINFNQFKDIIHTCGGIPRLTLTAPFIGRAKNKEGAYSTLVLQKDKWPSEAFEEMRYAFAYDALPPHCKGPFLDFCSFFKGWAWDSVEDIVGKDKMEMLESRALVTRITNGVSS